MGRSLCHQIAYRTSLPPVPIAHCIPRAREGSLNLLHAPSSLLSAPLLLPAPLSSPLLSSPLAIIANTVNMQTLYHFHR